MTDLTNTTSGGSDWVLPLLISLAPLIAALLAILWWRYWKIHHPFER